MVNYSGFLSNFTGTTSTIDILSDLVTGNDHQIKDSNGNNTGVLINWKYFYLGNLLIQFTNNINNGNLTGNGTYTLRYGLSYSSAPYFISLTPVDTNNSGPAYVTLNSLTNTDFEFYISGGGSLTALVIGST